MKNNTGLSDELLEILRETPENEEYEGHIYNHVFESQPIANDYDELWEIYYTQDGVLYMLPARRSGRYVLESEWEGIYSYETPSQVTQHGLAQAIFQSDYDKMQKLIWKVMQKDEPRKFIEDVLDEYLIK